MNSTPQDQTPNPGDTTKTPIPSLPDDHLCSVGSTPISIGNFSRYQVTAKTDEFTCTVGPFQTYGHVFLNADILTPPRLGMEPVMVIELPYGEISHYRQFREPKNYRGYSPIEVGTIWLGAYLRLHGGVELCLWEVGQLDNLWVVVKGLVAQGCQLRLYRRGIPDEGRPVSVDQITAMLESGIERSDSSVLLLRTHTAPERLIKRGAQYLP
jgi:hypothetical protein